MLKVTAKKSWSRMNKTEKKIALCKDVTEQVKAGVLEITAGVYCSFAIYIKHRKQANIQIDGVKNACQVCAKGALFITDVIKRNAITGFKVSTTDEIGMTKRLSGVFSSGELDTIECAFEREVVKDSEKILREINGYMRTYTPLANKAVKFGKKYITDKNRLIAIMKNIIKNGSFKP